MLALTGFCPCGHDPFSPRNRVLFFMPTQELPLESINIYGGTQARVRVMCHDNIFFDVSNTNFTITGSSDVIFKNGFQRPTP